MQNLKDLTTNYLYFWFYFVVCLYETAKDRSKRAGAITVLQFLFCISTLYFVILICVCMKQQKMNFSSSRASSAITAA